MSIKDCSNPKLIRITTVPISLKTLLRGQFRFMEENGFDVLCVSSSGEELQDVQERENVRVTALEMTRTISPFRDLRALWQFYKLCKKEKPTVVHSHTPKAGIVGMLGAMLAGVPIRLHTVAGLPLMEATGMKRTLLDFVERLTYRCATRVYPNSKGLGDFISSHRYTTGRKLHVIGNGSSNGIDADFFSPGQVSDEQKEKVREETGLKQNDFVFVFIGRLVGDKGINELVAAFRSVTGSRLSGEPEFPQDNDRKEHSHPDTRLLLVGSFERELDPLQPETLREIETNPNIISVGYKTDVRPYFAVSDVLVFPSYREGFPNVVMQGGAMGLPSIVSDINGCNEIIMEGENGKIVPPKDIPALQGAMESLMKDRIFNKEIAEKARPLIISRYGQQTVWKALLEEYNMLLEAK